MSFVWNCSRTALLAGAMALTGTLAQAATISGAGASFPAPIYAQWAAAYQQATGNQINYASIGSGGGINQVQNRTVTFGATDQPLGGDELTQSSLVQFPTVIGGIVPVVHLDGVSPGQIVLDGPTLAHIFMGTISNWNDPAITALNPDVVLPDAGIAVIHRSDASGTTFNFTNYLSKVSPDWEGGIGSATSVEWPVGIGAKGNEGVAATVGQTANSIGYVEYAYALQNDLTYTDMINMAGQEVAPEAAAFAAAAEGADWSSEPGFGVVLSDQPGEASWPMTAATFILIPADPRDPDAAAEALRFFDWAYTNGDDIAQMLDYIPMPDVVVEQITQEWAEIVGPDGMPVYPGS